MGWARTTAKGTAVRSGAQSGRLQVVVAAVEVWICRAGLWMSAVMTIVAEVAAVAVQLAMGMLAFAVVEAKLAAGTLEPGEAGGALPARPAAACLALQPSAALREVATTTAHQALASKARDVKVPASVAMASEAAAVHSAARGEDGEVAHGVAA